MFSLAPKPINIWNETIKETDNETNMDEESRRGSANIQQSTIKSDKEIRLNVIFSYQI